MFGICIANALADVCLAENVISIPTHTWYGYPYLYFDPRPKNRKEDLYGREKELEQFSRALPYAPLIVITGLRRTDKTSFLNVALAESNQPHAVLDLRGLPYNPSYADIVRRLEAFNRGTTFKFKWKTFLHMVLRIS